jgi:predicted amidophosphoribosyltransferase
MSDVISLAEAGGTPPIVVPMPTTPARVRRRGYNQASLLAQGFAEARGLTLVEALQRTRDGPTQVALQPSERKANVKGAFAVRTVHSARLNGAHVLRIDDVLTTGSTASAAASELASRGAAEVVLVTYARALPFRLGMER